MPTQPYYVTDGTRVPSVTTVLNIVDKPALKPWAFSEGRKSGRNELLGKPFAATLSEVTQDALNIGSIVHLMVETDVKGGIPKPPDDLDGALLERVMSGYSAYLSWKNGSRIKIVEAEIPLISEKHRFGGTADFVAELDGQLVLGDVKTSNSVYAEYLAQMAAYGAAYEEVRGEKVTGYHLLRFAKEHGDFAHHYYPNLDDALDAFLTMRRLYEQMAKLRRRAA